MLIKQIKKEKIVKKVMSELKIAKKEILATMSLAEELAYPLPVEYHLLIKKKAKQGLIIKRIGFGSNEDYNTIKRQYKIKSNNYSFVNINDLELYQRMLIIDQKIVFLGTGDTFIYSTNQSIILVVRDYFFQTERKGKIL